MSITIDAFGKPFVAEWHSGDRRRFATRSGCLHLVSFGGSFLEYERTALEQAMPSKLETCWIRNPYFAGDEEPDPHFHDLPKAQGNECRLPVEPDTTVENLSDWSRAGALRIHCAEVVKHLFCNGTNTPSTLAQGTPGMEIVRAELTDGKILFLRSGDIQGVIPSEAERHFAEMDALKNPPRQIEAEATQEEKSLESLLNDLPITTDDKRAFIDALILSGAGFTKSDLAALGDYASGSTGKEACKIPKISVRHFWRKLKLIPPQYREPFKGSPKQRRLRCKLKTAAQKEAWKADMRKRFEIAEREAAERKAAQEDDAFGDDLYPVPTAAKLR
jgi:hypothetical protein